MYVNILVERVVEKESPNRELTKYLSDHSTEKIRALILTSILILQYQF